jgi:hypothetical protein
MQLDKMDHTSFQRFMLLWTIAILRHRLFLPLSGLLWHISSNRIWAASLLRFLDLPWTIDQLVAEVANYTTHNILKIRTSMPSARFEPAITTLEQLQTYALDRTATGIGPLPCYIYAVYNILRNKKCKKCGSLLHNR